MAKSGNRVPAGLYDPYDSAPSYVSKQTPLDAKKREMKAMRDEAASRQRSMEKSTKRLRPKVKPV